MQPQELALVAREEGGSFVGIDRPSRPARREGVCAHKPRPVRSIHRFGDAGIHVEQLQRTGRLRRMPPIVRIGGNRLVNTV